MKDRALSEECKKKKSAIFESKINKRHICSGFKYASKCR